MKQEAAAAFHDLRATLQWLQEGRDNPAVSQERIRGIRELVTPDLSAGFSEIIAMITRGRVATDDHPERERVDVDAGELRTRIAAWMDALVGHVARVRPDLSRDGVDDLRASCERFFRANAEAVNTSALEDDLRDAVRRARAGDAAVSAFDRDGVSAQLAAKYHFRPRDVRAVATYVEECVTKRVEFDLQSATELVRYLWEAYGRGSEGGFARVSGGHFLARLADFAGGAAIAELGVTAPTMMGFIGLGALSDRIRTATELQAADLRRDVLQRVNARIVESLFFRDLEFSQGEDVGRIIDALQRGKDAIARLVGDVLPRLGPAAVSVVGTVAFMSYMNPIVGGVGLVSIPLMGWVARQQTRRIEQLYDAQSERAEASAGKMASMQAGMQELRVLPHRAEAAADLLRTMNAAAVQTAEATKGVETASYRSRVPTTIASATVALITAAIERTGAAVLANFVFAQRAYGMVHELVSTYCGTLPYLHQQIRRMEELLGRGRVDRPDSPEEAARTGASQLPSTELTIEDLRVRDRTQGRDILRDVDIVVRPGEFVTLSGDSGGGKSTIIRSVAGLVQPDSGSIRIGGVPTRSIKQHGDDSVYSLIGYSPQRPQIFRGMTLRENLLLWSHDAVSPERIAQVLRDLKLEKFLEGLDAPLTHEPSGGELVRIGIARVLLKGAKVLLLDEPTSGLDESSSAPAIRELLTSIPRLYPEVSVLCVSHDRELIAAATRGYVVTPSPEGATSEEHAA